MKLIIWTLLISLFTLVYTLSCSLEKDKKIDSEDEKIIKMLRNFYTLYIIERTKPKEDWKKIENLKYEYCTLHFSTKIKNEELDADPFINAQDFNEDWLKTLSIDKITNDPTYKVCFIITNDKTNLHCVNVSVKKENSIWKIDDVRW